VTLCCLPTGLILADSINMLLRIAFSLVYVHSLCGASAGVRLTAFFPRPGTLTALSAAFVITGVVCCPESFSV
jgi:Rft protein